MWEGPYGNFGSRKYLTASIDQSLRRMGLDYVDIFYHHRMDKETPLEETMTALVDIVRSGKALYIGVSNYDKEYTEEAVKFLKEQHCPVIVNQRKYSIFDRTIAFSPLAQGMLTDKYLHGIPKDSRIARDHRFLHAEDLTDERLEQIRRLNELAGQRGQTLAQMALSWVLKDDKVCSVLIGASKPEQISENISVADSAEFTQEELDIIDEICKRS